MKKIIGHYGFLLMPVIVITALIIAMFSEGGNDLILKWASLSIMWVMGLWYLKKPAVFYAIIKDKVFIGYLFFVGWAIFSSLFLSSVKSISIIMLMPFIGGLLSYLIACNGSDKKERYFDRLLLALGILLVLTTCYQKFILGVSRPTGLLANWNSHAALLAIIILPWIIRYALKPSISQIQLIYISLLSFLFAFAMGLTLSRGALLIIITGIACLICLALRQRIFYKQGLIFLAALMLGYISTSFIFAENIVQRVSESSDADSLTALGSGRHLLWLPAWQMFLDKPLTGWGLDVFRFLYVQYKPPLSEEIGHFAHNDYLQFLVELGPIGLLIFISVVIIIVNRLYRLIFTFSPLSSHKIEAFTLLTTATGLLLHSFLTFNLYHLTMQILFGSYLGRAARHLQLEGETAIKIIDYPDSQQYNGCHKGFASVIALLIICFGFSFYNLNKAEQTKNQQEKLDDYWKAGITFPFLERYDSLSASLLTQQLNQTQASSEQHQQITTYALNEVNSAINKMPFNPQNYLIKANILKTMPVNISEIWQQYEKALLIAPHRLNIRSEYAHSLIKHQQHQKALAVMWAAWERLYSDYYQNGIQFLTDQLEMNKQYGKKEDNLIIEQEIQRLTKLKNKIAGGQYIFTKEISANASFPRG